MRITNIVEMVKEIGRERLLEDARKHHSRRYQRPLTSSGRYEPDTSQLAEDDDPEDMKKEKKNGKTETGKTANKIITEPEIYSSVPMPKGSRPPDTK